MALEKPELNPRELAVTFKDTKGYFVSEASVYRLLKAPVVHKPRLLSDNGASYIPTEMAEWLDDDGMSHRLLNQHQLV